MSNINHVVITGNLVRESELRATAGGSSVLGFTVAVNDRVKNNQTGQWEDRANYIDCTMFGTRADALSRLLHKGSKVAVEGKLHWSSWETKDGQKRSKVEVWPDNVELLTPKQQQAKDPGTQAVESYFGVTAQEVYDDVEIPF